MSRTLKEERGLRCYGHKMEEVTGGGRKSRNREICDLCASRQMLLGCPNQGGYNPPDYSIGRHVFLSGILSVLSGGTVNLVILVTMNFISINSRF